MKLARIGQYYQQHGFRRLLLRCAAQFGFRSRHEVFVFTEHDFADLPERPLGSPEVLLVSEVDIRREPDYFDGWYGEREAIARLRRGCLLFALRQDSRLVAFVWIERHTTTFRLLDSRFELPSEVAYVSGLYTAPEARRQGLGALTLCFALQHLKAQGYLWAFSLVRPWNEASLGMTGKVGFRPYQTVTYDRRWFHGRYHVQAHDRLDETTLSRWLVGSNPVWRVYARLGP